MGRGGCLNLPRRSLIEENINFSVEASYTTSKSIEKVYAPHLILNIFSLVNKIISCSFTNLTHSYNFKYVR